MEALRGVVRCAIRAAQLGKGNRGVVDWVLGIRQATPMAAVDDEDGEWEGCESPSASIICTRWDFEAERTVSKDELADTGDVHRYAS